MGRVGSRVSDEITDRNAARAEPVTESSGLNLARGESQLGDNIRLFTTSLGRGSFGDNAGEICGVCQPGTKAFERAIALRWRRQRFNATPNGLENLEVGPRSFTRADPASKALAAEGEPTIPSHRDPVGGEGSRFWASIGKGTGEGEYHEGEHCDCREHCDDLPNAATRCVALRGSGGDWSSLRRTGRGSGPGPGGSSSPIVYSDIPPLDDELDQARPLLILGQPFNSELAIERTQMGLHRVDAKKDLIGDLLVGRREGEPVAIGDRPAQGDKNAMLRVGQLHLTGTNTRLNCSYPWRTK